MPGCSISYPPFLRFSRPILSPLFSQCIPPLRRGWVAMDVRVFDALENAIALLRPPVSDWDSGPLPETPSSFFSFSPALARPFRDRKRIHHSPACAFFSYCPASWLTGPNLPSAPPFLYTLFFSFFMVPPLRGPWISSLNWPRPSRGFPHPPLFISIAAECSEKAQEAHVTPVPF